MAETVSTYTLTISTGVGYEIIVDRLVHLGSDKTGILSSGAAIYDRDELKITVNPVADYSITSSTINGVSFTSGNTLTVSGNVTVEATATPLASSVSATSADIGSVSTISIKKRDSAYVNTLSYEFGRLTGTIVHRTSSTSIEWVIPESFYEQIPNARTGVCKFTCSTYKNSLLIGSSSCSVEITTNASSCKPSMSSYVKDTNATTIALTGDDSTLIRYKSTALCTLEARAQNSARITSLLIGGVAVTGTSRDGTVIATKTYPNVFSSSFTFSSQDSRLYVANTKLTPKMIEYVPLTLTPVLDRSSEGTSILLSFSGNLYRGSFGAYSNTIRLNYRYKKSGGSYCAWKEVDMSNVAYGTSSYNSNGTVSLGNSFDVSAEYVFEIRATDGTADNVLSTVTKTAVISKYLPSFDWGKDGFNLNVPLMLNQVNIFDIFYPVGAVYLHGGSTLPAPIAGAGAWTSIPSGIEGVCAWKRIS